MHLPHLTLPSAETVAENTGNAISKARPAAAKALLLTLVPALDGASSLVKVAAYTLLPAVIVMFVDVVVFFAIVFTEPTWVEVGRAFAACASFFIAVGVAGTVAFVLGLVVSALMALNAAAHSAADWARRNA